MTVRIGVIGTGRWAAQHHIPAVLEDPRAQLTALVDPSSEKLALAAERFGVPHTYLDHEAMLDADEVDTVVVASPPAAHHAAAAAALARGKHVLVEKPMTVDPAEAWDLVDRARASGCELIVGYTFHFTRHAAAARELVASGAIGDLQLVSGLYASAVRHLFTGRWHTKEPDPLAKPDAATFNDPKVSGGGQAAGQVTHALASILHTTGEHVTKVSALMREFGLRVDLADALLLDFAGGGVGTVASVGSLQLGQPMQWEFRYYGSEGFVLHDLATGRLEAYLHDGKRIDEPPLDPAEVYPTKAPVHRLVDLALGHGENVAPAELGAHVVDVVDAAYRSACVGEPLAIVERPR